MKRAVGTLVTLFALLSAVAHADVGNPPGVGKHERAAIRAGVRTSAKSFLATQGPLRRPSVRVVSLQRTATGHVSGRAQIMSLTTSWPTMEVTRVSQYTAEFTARPVGDGRYEVRMPNGWQVILSF